MSRIKIKNFGPIKEGMLENDGWIDIKKVTMFIGNQGSGKSTVAKLITTFLWMEKALTRGDYEKKWFTRKNKLKNQFLGYFRMENYFSEEAEEQPTIEFEGDSYCIYYKDGILDIKEVPNSKYPLPQIMYVPAERNFISYVKNTKELKIASESLREFITEFEKAKEEIKGSIKLPINDVELEHDKLNDILNIKGKVKAADYRIKLTEASSGFQSTTPLYLVSWYLANNVKKQSQNPSEPMSSEELERFKRKVADILSNESLSPEQQRAAISVLSNKFNKTAFINIVEELEQNLFPTSQKQILYSLLAFNNMNDGNMLIMTTHSPYLINDLTLAIEAKNLHTKIEFAGKGQHLNAEVNKIVPENSLVKGTDVAIYEMDETIGTISLLGNYKGLPSDENKLNQELEFGNDQFSELLNIEDLCQ